MKNRTLLILLAMLAALGIGLSLATPAEASTVKRYTATVSGISCLKITADRTIYSSTRTSIKAYATPSCKQVIDNNYDIIWKYHDFSSTTGLQQRWVNPAYWGTSVGNNLPRTVEYIKVTFYGENTAGKNGYRANVTVRVGY